MFYALSSVGAFAQGAQKRRREIRSERAAIREEFERWKANNPYATAGDFHAKVKQLGATSPGGNVALPDSASIQRMAAENLRRKQQEEADRARRLRADNLNMARVEMAFLKDQIYSGVDVDEALRKAGMDLSPENFALAKGIKQDKDAKAAETDRLEEQRKIDREFSRSLQVLNAEQAYLKANPFVSPAEASQVIAQRLGMANQGSTTYGPTMQGASLSDNGVLHVQGAFDRMLPTLFENNKVKYTGPNGYEMLKRDAVQLATSGGSSLPPEQIVRALEGTNFMAQFNAQIDDLAFASQLGGKQPSELSITVGDGKNAMAIELAEIYKSQLNNSNILSSRRIPYDKLDEFQSIVAPYFEIADGTVQMKPLPPTTSMEQVLAQVEQQLNTAGIYNQDQLAMQRQRKIAEYGQVDSLDILLAKQESELKEVVEDATKAMKEADSAAGQQAVLNEVAQRFDYFKGLIENDRIADIYANGGVYPLDILPTNQHALYQKDAFYALFDDAMAELNQIAAANKAQVQTDGEANEAAETARLQDVALQVMQSDFGDEQVEAVLELVVPTERRMASIETDAEGNIQYDRRGQLPDSLLVNELTSSDKTRRTGVAKAVATAVEVFNSFRDMPVSEVGMANKQGFGGIAMGAAQSYVSRNFSQALAPFPQYNAALKSATDQFKATVQLIPGLSSDDIEELGTEFNAWLLQSTRNFFNAGSTGPYAKLNQPGRFEGFRLPSGQVDAAQRQMLQRSVPGAQLVVPN